jgi:SAM-dependent methyltransferase
MNNRSIDFLDAVAAQLRAQSRSGEQPETFTDRPRTDELIAGIESGQALIGIMPPQPPTLRGRIGGILVSFIQRCLFWYTPRIVHFQRAVAAAFREQEQAALTASRELTRQFSAVQEENRSLREAIRIATNAHRSAEATLTGVELELQRHNVALVDLEQANSRVQVLENNLRDLAEALQTNLGQVNTTSEAMAANHATLAGDVTQWAEAVRVSEQKLDTVEKFTLSTRAQMLLLERRVSELQRKAPAPVASERAGRPDALLSDELYFEFEAQFRGSEEEIKERVRVYVPRLRNLNIGSPEMPVVDVGCGRGEWIEVLRENGLLAYGVDANSVAVARCREKGLAVEEQDGLEHVRSLADRSVGAITAFHFVEHLPLEVLLRFLDEALRVLKPGGVVLLETPNPDSLQVGANTFYLDPTHQRPIPAGLLRFLLESRGFGSIEVLPLHPYPANVQLNEDSAAARLLNERLFGCQDYGVLAIRP